MNKRTYIGIGLVFIIAITAVYLVLNWQTAFSRNIKITYPDGCVEKYKNDNLTTPECTKGRLMQYQQELQRNNTRYGYGQWGNISAGGFNGNNTVPVDVINVTPIAPIEVITNITQLNNTEVNETNNTTQLNNTEVNETNNTTPMTYRERMKSWNNTS